MLIILIPTPGLVYLKEWLALRILITQPVKKCYVIYNYMPQIRHQIKKKEIGDIIMLQTRRQFLKNISLMGAACAMPNWLVAKTPTDEDITQWKLPALTGVQCVPK